MKRYIKASGSSNPEYARMKRALTDHIYNFLTSATDNLVMECSSVPGYTPDFCAQDAGYPECKQADAAQLRFAEALAAELLAEF